MSLCWKCREKVKWVDNDDSRMIFDILHCHHDEPEEKPPCWCSPQYYINDSTPSILHRRDNLFFHANFCPECGRKL